MASFCARRSVRRFRPDPLPRALVSRLLEAAILAYFDGVPANEGGEVPPNDTQLPSIEAVNP